jgi:L-seryl-tRNA(Ser) seleniumtransferase
MDAMATELRHLPSVDKLLSHERLQRLGTAYPHELVVDVIRERLEEAREAAGKGAAVPPLDELAEGVVARLEAVTAPPLRRVINASGVIIHTNLGRAPLSPETLAAMSAAGVGYSNLEFDLNAGVRGSRHVHVESLLCRLTGAEAAVAVNNNAAAVLLGLSAVARRKEVIVSRGQAVEIGGGFRIPDVMRQSGAKLIEVGTTNATYPHDYENAVTGRTAALMRVHSSNFRIVGFTNETTLEDVIAIAKKHGLVVLDDLGSGCLLDTTAFGLAPEPTVQHSVRAGVDLTFFSGDKLIGGPQAGIVVGKKEHIARLKRHPLARSSRMDKSRLAGLAATLRHYLMGEATDQIPVWRMIAMPVDDIEKRARAWAKLAGGKVVDGETMVGGGSLPGGSLPTKLVALSGGRTAVKRLAEKLRAREVPVVGRISDDALLLDPRTVLPEEDSLMREALKDLPAA